MYCAAVLLVDQSTRFISTTSSSSLTVRVTSYVYMFKGTSVRIRINSLRFYVGTK